MRYLIILTTLLTVSCNTFGTPEFIGDAPTDSGMNADADGGPNSSDAGPDGGVDSDSGSDAGPMEPDWTTTSTNNAEINPLEVSEILEVCPNGEILVTQAIGGGHDVFLTTIVPGFGEERMVITYIDNLRELNVEIVGESETTSLLEETFAVPALRDPSQTPAASRVDVETIGGQLMVAALDESNTVRLVQCSLLGNVGCRHFTTDVTSDVVGLGKRGSTFYLYVTENDSIVERAIRSEDTLQSGEPGNAVTFMGAEAFYELEYGFGEDGTPLLVAAIEVGLGVTYRVSEYRGQSGWSVPAATIWQMGATVSDPRARIMNHRNDVWVVQNDQEAARVDVFSIYRASMDWTLSDDPVGAKLRAYDLSAVENNGSQGYAELFVEDNGATKVVIADATEMTAANNIGGVTVGRPARVAVANATPNILTRQVDSLVLYRLCQTE